LGLALTVILLPMASQVAKIISTCHHTQLLLVEMGFATFFAWAGQ
jgi:hypothetical protein